VGRSLEDDAVISTKHAIVYLALCLLTAPSAHAQSQPAAITFDSGQTLLMFMQPDEASEILANHRPSAVDPRSPAESAVIAECARGSAGRGVVSKGILSGIQRQAVNAVLAQVSERVRREIDQYSTMFSQSASIDYYAPSPAPATNHRLQTQYSCFRFAQADLTPSGNLDIAFDFVAAIGIADAQDAVIVRPLRLFVARPSVKSKDRSLGIAIGMRADAIWREATRGVKDTVWDETVLRDGIDLAKGPALRYFLDGSAPDVRLPLPPTSVGVDTARPYGHIDVTVTAAEVGALPTSLELLGDIFLPSRDRSAGLLYQAAAARTQPLVR